MTSSQESIPHKAYPDMPGKMIRFSSTKRKYDAAGHYDTFLTSYLMMNTDAVSQAAGYDVVPSVLILTTAESEHLSDESIQRIQEVHIPDLEVESMNEYEDKLDSETGIYFISSNKEESRFATEAEERWNENDFLESIVVYPDTGIHVSYLDNNGSISSHATLVKLARKYFDIVLVSPSALPSLDKESDVRVMEYVSPKWKNKKNTKRLRFSQVRCYDFPMSTGKDKNWGNDAFSIRYLTTEDKELERLMGNSIIAAAFSENHAFYVPKGYKVVHYRPPTNPLGGLERVKLTISERVALTYLSARQSSVAMIPSWVALLAGGGWFAITAGMVPYALLLDPTGPETIELLQFGLISGAVAGAGFVSKEGIENRAPRGTVRHYTNRLLRQSFPSPISNALDDIPVENNPVFISAGITPQERIGIAKAELNSLKELENEQLRKENHSSSNDASSLQRSAVANVKSAFEMSTLEEHTSAKQTIQTTSEDYDSVPSPSQAPKPPALRSVLLKRLDKLKSDWMSYELDPLKSLDYPLMLDATCPQTRRFIMAMNEVVVLEDELESGSLDLRDFREVLLLAEEAFLEAKAHAKKMRYAHLDTSQRKKIKDARPLVALLDDEGASPHEKVSAYRRAGDMLEGILVLPDRPIMGLIEAV